MRGTDGRGRGRAARAPALGFPDFRRLLAARLATTLGTNAQAVAVGWQVYDISRDPFHLGVIGLVQFLPAFLLVLVTGAVADHYDRRAIAAVSFVLLALASAMLTALSLAGVATVWPFIAVMGVIGTVRAFLNPALQALIPNVVPAEHLANAVALNSIVARTGAAIGPLAGGLLYGAASALPYASIALVYLVAAGVAATIRQTGQLRSAAGVALQTLTAGLQYIGRTKVLLGAVTMDFFATFMGGVTALLPVFARDILHAGPGALGLLRAAPAIGGMSVALLLSIYPIRERAGVLIFATMALFGLSAVVFGLSTVVWMSFVALVVMGAADMMNVYFRWSLVQLWTPDAVRGRVSAVTSVSANGSTELGDFRAGLSAALLGPVAAVVLGGMMTLAGVALWARLFPQLVRTSKLVRPGTD